MRGQLILLTAFIAAVAVAAIMAAQIALQMGSYSAGARTGYGIYAKAWPEAVDLADSHTLQATLKSSSQLATAATSGGLYAGYSTMPYDVVAWYLNRSLSLVKAALLPLGAQIDFQYNLLYRGFNGTLGPYPQAVTYSRWSLQPIRQGFLTIPGATLYRLVVTWQSDDYSGYYVVTYGSHVSEPGSVGETYNVALADLLRRLNDPTIDIKSSLYAFLVDSQTCSLYQLPWWAEIKNCPLCLLHVRLPPSIEVPNFKFEKGKAVEMLLVFVPNLLGDEIPVLKSGPCAGGQQQILSDIVKVNKDVNNEPKAVFARQINYDAYGRPQQPDPQYSYFWDYRDIRDPAKWERKEVRTYSSCYPNPVSGGVSGWVTDWYDSGYGQVAYIYADYRAGTKNWGFNVYYGPLDVSPSTSGWRGFAVEALVKPLRKDTIRPARLDLFYYSSGPSTTHPICSNLFAVQAVSPAIVWANQRSSNNGVWNGRTWDDAGVITLASQWYLYSIAADSSKVVYSVYDYNATRPLKRLGIKTWQGNPWGTTWKFYIVLGSAIVDNPASSTSPWREEAYYAYVRVRPWVDPPPAVALAPLGTSPLGVPNRVDVVALAKAQVKSQAVAYGGIGVAGIDRLVINRAVSLNATILTSRVKTPNDPNQVTVEYIIQVNSSIPRGSLAAGISLFYSLGSTYVNASCVNSPLCYTSLVEYRGYAAGVDAAVYNVTFTKPRGVSHAIVINVFGTKVAVSSTRPNLYALAATGRSWYLINLGNGTGVLIIPWDSTAQGYRSIVYSLSPQDPSFVGVYDVSYGGKSWTILLLAPRSLVNITFTRRVSFAELAQFVPPWQPAIQQLQPPCSNPQYMRVYMPGNVSLGYYIVYVPPNLISSTKLSAYFFNQGWQLLQLHRDNVGGLWVKLTGSLTRRAALVAFCDGTSSLTSPTALFDFFVRNVPGGYSQLLSSGGTLYASLQKYPDGFTVVFGRYSSTPTGLALYNSSLNFQCQPTRLMVGMQYDYVQSQGYTWLWQFDGFCFDQAIWERVGPTSPIYNFTISITKQMAMYQIFTFQTGQTVWSPWVRSYPNSAPALGGGPLSAFLYAYADQKYSVAIMPFTWPRPYFFIDPDLTRYETT